MKKALLTLFLSLMSFTLFSESYTGSEIANSGEVKTISGILKNIDDEFYIDNNSGLFQLHMGPEDYMESLNYAPQLGTSITVKGFFMGDHIAPMVITIAKKDYNFRDNNGSPMWRGSGQGKGEDDNHEH